MIKGGICRKLMEVRLFFHKRDPRLRFRNRSLNEIHSIGFVMLVCPLPLLLDHTRRHPKLRQSGRQLRTSFRPSRRPCGINKTQKSFGALVISILATICALVPRRGRSKMKPRPFGSACVSTTMLSTVKTREMKVWRRSLRLGQWQSSDSEFESTSGCVMQQPNVVFIILINYRSVWMFVVYVLLRTRRVHRRTMKMAPQNQSELRPRRQHFGKCITTTPRDPA